MIKKNVLLLIAMLSFGFGGAVSAGDYTGEAQIVWLGTIVGNTFTVSGNWSNVLNCSNTTGNMWKIYSVNSSMDELKVMYSTALAAYLAGKTIELYSHECGSDGRPHARSMYIPQR